MPVNQFSRKADRPGATGSPKSRVGARARLCARRQRIQAQSGNYGIFQVLNLIHIPRQAIVAICVLTTARALLLIQFLAAPDLARASSGPIASRPGEPLSTTSERYNFPSGIRAAVPKAESSCRKTPDNITTDPPTSPPSPLLPQTSSQWRVWCGRQPQWP